MEFEIMSLQDIKKAIALEARAEVKKIEKDTDAKVATAQKVWQEKIAEKKAAILDRAKRTAEQKVRQESFQARAEAQSRLLSKKRELIEQVYKKTLDKLASLSGSEYQEFIKKLVETLPTDSGEVAAPKDKLSMTKKAFGAKAKKFKMVSGELSGNGGFVVRDKGLLMDYSFGALVENSKDRTELEVSQLLFS